MGTKLVAGGIIEKDNKFLLVKETQEKCKGKWNLPAGKVDDGENIIEAAEREVFEETGCTVKLTGIADIINKNLENYDLLVFFFDTELVNDNVHADGEEISDVKWFTYEEILKMNENDELRAKGYFLNALKNKIEGKIVPLDLININN